MVRRFAPQPTRRCSPSRRSCGDRVRDDLPALRDLAAEQSTWLCRALRVRATSIVRSRPSPARRVHLHDRPDRLAFLLLPIVPASANDQRRAVLGADRADRLPALGARQGLHRRLPRVVPIRSGSCSGSRPGGSGRSGSRRRSTSGRWCSRGEPRSWSSSCRSDLGASLLYFAIFVVMLWVATARRRTWSSASSCSRWERGSATWRSATCRRASTLAARARSGHAAQGGRPARRRAVRHRRGVASCGSGLGQGVPISSPSRRPTSSSRPSARNSGSWDHRGAAAVRGLIGRGLQTAHPRTDDFGKLLATGLATARRAPGVRDRRRRDPGDPADRRDAPVHELRRLEPGENFIILALLVRVSSGPAPQRGPLRGPVVRGSREESADGQQIRRLGIALLVLFVTCCSA